MNLDLMEEMRFKNRVGSNPDKRERLGEILPSMSKGRVRTQFLQSNPYMEVDG